MKTTEIIMTCDICKKIMSENSVKSDLTMSLRGAGLESGTALGPAYKSGDYDLCIACYDKITTLMDEMEK